MHTIPRSTLPVSHRRSVERVPSIPCPPTATVSIEETGRETQADMECARNPRPGAGFFSEKENINGFSLSIRNVFINFVAG